MPHTVVMVATSYPRFPGDTVGTFMEPIAKHVAARGHRVHLVAPWHPLVRRPPLEDGVHFHFFKYAPTAGLNIFGYAGALRADVSLRAAAFAIAPVALLAGWRAARAVARRVGATVMHGHWVIPGGAIAAFARPGLPLVVSLHGSDVYVAERHALAGRVARATFGRAGWVTACSADLRQRAIGLGASADRTEVVPYGVDADRFAPSPERRLAMRAALGVAPDTKLVAAIGRLVRKKGFEYLIDAMPILIARIPQAQLVIAGSGDLERELEQRITTLNLKPHVRMLGAVNHDDVAGLLAAADVVAVPSVRDDSGNVDGLPNVVMEALASGTALVTTTAGGIGAVTTHGQTAWHVPERDSGALAEALTALLENDGERHVMSTRARTQVVRDRSWQGVAERFEHAYGEAVQANARRGRSGDTARDAIT